MRHQLKFRTLTLMPYEELPVPVWEGNGGFWNSQADRLRPWHEEPFGFISRSAGSITGHFGFAEVAYVRLRNSTSVWNLRNRHSDNSQLQLKQDKPVGKYLLHGVVGLNSEEADIPVQPHGLGLSVARIAAHD